jgi:rSAM/selenodomain-associated transferase 1
MVRCPEPGKVKSRLAAGVGETCAFKLYECFVEDLLSNLEGISADVRIGFHPPSDEKCIRDWLGEGIELTPQVGAHLGEKQAGLLERAFSMGYGSSIVMISDAPDIPRNLVESGIKALGSSDSVIGPCHDGGYYLIGFRSGKYNRNLFSDIPWGSSETTTRMVEAIKSSGLDIMQLDPWWDIDVLADLEKMYSRALKNGYSGRTVSYIRRQGLFHE